MYPGITLYPGGAFTLCESVGEFDDNVQYPIPADPGVAKAEVSGADPVAKTISKLEPTYQNYIVPLLTMDYGYSDAEDGIRKMEIVSTSMSEVVNSLLRQIGKMTGILRIARNHGDFVMEDFAPHVGYFMQNIQKIKQQGIESCTMKWGVIPAFNRQWNIGTLLDVVETTPEIMDSIMGFQALRAISGEPIQLFDIFEGSVDLLRCIYTDPDRRMRLETEDTRRIVITEMIRTRPNWECLDRVTCYQDEDIERMSRRYFRMASCCLRDVAKACYETQCKLSDNNMSADEFAATIKPMLAKCVNLFAVGTALLMHIAYDTRQYCAMKDAVSEYTELLLKTLKTV